MTRRAQVTITFCLSVVLPCLTLHAQMQKQTLDAARFDQRLAAQVPMDATFVDETGAHVQLKDYAGDRPVILVMAYYTCPMLCNLVLDGLVDSLNSVALVAGRDFHVVVVSIDPKDTPQIAAKAKQRFGGRYIHDAQPGWHFLTGPESSIRPVAMAVGFGYAYDEATLQYAHPSGIVFLTPGGVVSRYQFGVAYNSRDTRLALVESSQGAIGTRIDDLLLRCFTYDPTTGRYGLTIITVLRILGTTTAATLGLTIGTLLWRERRRAVQLRPSGEGARE